jgi:Zn-dependent M28 family amino/carboxypeptidase
MTSPARVAVAVATIVLTSLVAGTAWAAPPQNYDQEAVGKLNAANSVETVRHLAVDIGPRRSATPEERAGAEYLKGVLEGYGFTVRLIDVPFTGTRNTAKVTSPNATLPNGPNWQMSSQLAGKITGDSAPVEAPVVFVPDGGATPDKFPADTSGKIVLMDQGATGAARNTQVANAVAAGAVAVILGNTATNSAPTTTITGLSSYPNTPILGGGRAHRDWIKGLVDAGPLTLKLVTNSYVNHPRTVVEGIRHAVGDPTGTTAPIISIGAHIDSVLGAPGAHDDATGNGSTIEIARVLSQMPLDKEIRVGGYGGEEDGLVGARYYVNNVLTAAEKARYVGHWQMDMVGTPYPPAEFWALVPNGTTNLVVDEGYAAAARAGFTGMQNCFLGQSDHQAYWDAGIPAALFIWLNYRKPALPRTCLTPPFTPDYTTEPEYHRPTDGMNNVSQERLQHTLNIVGGAAIHMAMNKVTFVVTNGSGQPVSGAKVTGDCGDGVRNLGESVGGVAEVFVPHVTCDFKVADGNAVGSANDVEVAGNRTITLSLTSASTDVSGSVPATLALTVGAPASFGAFTPGVARDYFASTTANVISTAGDALLSVADTSSTATGHLVNGAFALPQPLQSRARNATTQGTAFNNVGSAASPLNLLAYGGPISNDAVSLDFKQAIGAADPLRTGTYSKTLTFTLSTTAP